MSQNQKIKMWEVGPTMRPQKNNANLQHLKSGEIHCKDQEKTFLSRWRNPDYQCMAANPLAGNLK